MKKTKLFWKSIHYSLSLAYQSSGLLIIVYFLLPLLRETLGLASTYSMKYLLDALAAAAPSLPPIILWITIYIGILLTTQLVGVLYSIVYISVTEKAGYLYDCRLTEKLAALPMSVIDSAVGKNMVDDVNKSKQMVIQFLSRFTNIVSLIYAFLAALPALFAFHPGFTLVFLLLTVPGIVLQTVYGRKADQLRQKQAPDVRKFSYYRWMLTDPWPAKDVRMYDLTDHIRRRYDQVKDEYLRENKRLDKWKLYASLLSEVLLRAGEILFTAFVVWKALAGDITLGDVTLYTGLSLSVARAFSSGLSLLMNTYINATAQMSRIFDFYAIPAEHETGTRALGSFASLEFRDVHFRYPHTENEVLKGVSFTLRKGEKLSLVGINGAGKSTIIKLMLGLYEVTAGQILLNGYPITDYSIQEVRQMFSALFQSFVQYPLTLRDNIALSDVSRMNDDQAVIDALQKSGVYEELSEKLSRGLDSFMTRQFDGQGTELSKGQWQKLALARVYFKDAEILIFDEPSAALDAEAEDRIFRNFASLSEGKTGIMISHRISAAKMASQIIVLEDGVITESGSHAELVERDGLYARMYRLQKEKYTTEVGIHG